MTQTARFRRMAPWRASPAQAAFIAAICGDASGDERLADWCRRHGTAELPQDVEPLLGYAVEPLRAIAPASSAARLAQRTRTENSRLNLLRIGGLLPVLQRFVEARVPVIVLKGTALALRYRSFGLRATKDVDLLVRSGDAARAATLLQQLGWTPEGDTSSPFLEEVVMRTAHARSFWMKPAHSLDLHWRVMNVVSPPVSALLWDAAETFEFEGAAVQVLSPVDQVFHICCHALNPTPAPSPCWMLDLHVVLQREGDRVVWERLVEIARRTNTSVRVRTALEEFDQLAGGCRIPAAPMHALALAPLGWEKRELAAFESMTPLSGWSTVRRHWYSFRRMREYDAEWQHRPLLAGFAAYVRLKVDERRSRARAVD